MLFLSIFFCFCQPSIRGKSAMNAIGVPTSFYVLLAATIVAAKSMLWKIPFVPAVKSRKRIYPFNRRILDIGGRQITSGCFEIIKTFRGDNRLPKANAIIIQQRLAIFITHNIIGGVFFALAAASGARGNNTQ